MKEKLWKWIKRYGVTVWLVTAAIALLVSVSYAAYITLDISKHVVSTGSGGNIVRFSSNYLYVTDIGGSYGTRKVTTMHDNEKNSDNFTVEVCNYIYGNTAAVNSSDIIYSLVAELVYTGDTPPEGITVSPASGESVSFVNGRLTIPGRTLPAGTATADKYVFSIPEGIKDQISIRIAAIPDDSSLSATRQKMLAAEIVFKNASLTNNWDGEFIDTKTVLTPMQYDGFNYEISGNGKGTVTITWKKDILEISPWFRPNGVEATKTNEGWSFPVGGDNQPSAYMTQFYIKDRTSFDAEFGGQEQAAMWEKLESLVTVSFVEKDNTGTTEATEAAG